ncbi:hypothetical protein MMC10_007497 [Thelotrema lepadinum]|nr:hypothetical protein [Thelotrema lepadinum]
MPSITLHPPASTRSSSVPSPLPPLLHTPLGFAILELQGTINIPDHESGAGSTRIGKLVFPDYDPERDADREGIWMKKVWLYVGHQRMLGEVRKLSRPLGVVGRKGALGESAKGVEGEGKGNSVGEIVGNNMDLDQGNENESGIEKKRRGEVEELEILELVRWKIVFSSRPEPFGEEEVN